MDAQQEEIFSIFEIQQPLKEDRDDPLSGCRREANAFEFATRAFRETEDAGAWD
nr:hypothetical protein [Bradyrhizobium symbiodeficiens]QIP02841.1 hypothetical protein HAU86_24995 [Bradyrhizobium symbiodeficiens]